MPTESSALEKWRRTASWSLGAAACCKLGFVPNTSGSLKPVVTVALAWHTQAQLQFQYLDFPDSTSPCLYTCNCTVSLKQGLTLHWLVRLKKMKGVLGL